MTRGYDEWKRFHDTYAKEQRQIRALDPGQATWGDVAAFAEMFLGAAPAEGFSVLRFSGQDGEVVAAPEGARVLSIEGRPWACGDYGGMPVTREDGAAAERLGARAVADAQRFSKRAFTGAIRDLLLG